MPMFSENALSIALKEWAAVCRALETGRQTILFRKGGIHEAAGEFELDHRQFLLFSTYLHQKLEMIKPSERIGVEEKNSEPGQIRISAAAEVTDILQIKHRDQLDRLDAEHIWLPALLDIRWNYRPENPLYLLQLRVYHLPEPITIPNTLAYAGCKSWVPLEHPIATAHALPVLSDDEYQIRRDRIFTACGLAP
jgi:hypothetical protein